MEEQNRKKEIRTSLLRVFILLGILALAVFLVWQAFGDMLPTLFRLLKKGDEAEIEAFIQAEGFWKGAIAVGVLSALQVVSIIFPGMAIQLAAGVIYGCWRSFLMCYIGFVLGNVLVFIVARRMGNHISGLVTVSKNDSWIREKMRSAHPGFVVALCDLLPGLPNGIIPYVAAQSSISLRDFFLAVAAGSLLQVLLNCAAGSFLQAGDFIFMALTFILQGAIFGLVIWKRSWIISLIPGGKAEQEKPEE